MIDEWQSLEERIHAWHSHHLGDVVVMEASVARMREEVDGLALAIETGDRADAVEACAGCIMELVRLLRGLGGATLTGAVADKLTKLEAESSERVRRWLEQTDEPEECAA